MTSVLKVNNTLDFRPSTDFGPPLGQTCWQNPERRVLEQC